MEFFLFILVVSVIAGILIAKDRIARDRNDAYVQETKLHLDALLRKKHQLIVYDDYGNQNAEKYFKEIDYFMLSTLNYKKYTRSGDGLFIHNMITNMVDAYDQKQLDKNNNDTSYIHFNEDMSPDEYEYFCRDLLNNDGFDAKVTQQSGDQGVDVMLYHNGNIFMAIQCKLYSKPVGNKAVQEVFAAKSYIGAPLSAVVTNNTYTRSAKELANKTGVLLLHHDDLRNLQSILDNTSK